MKFGLRKLTDAEARLVAVQAQCAGHLDEIRACFKPGVKTCLTVRTPGEPERDFVMTDDSLDEVKAMLGRRAAAGPDNG